jgi:hypothetical protein
MDDGLPTPRLAPRVRPRAKSVNGLLTTLRVANSNNGHWDDNE